MTLHHQAQKMPTLYLPHGAGPCFFMDWTMGPADTWKKTAAWLTALSQTMAKPKAIVVISGHWEEASFKVTSSANPELIYDYYGFPQHTYELKYPVAGAPALASQIVTTLRKAGLAADEDAKRGLDHGVFIPFKLIYPAADIPIVQLSLVAGLDPALHLAAGRALAGLREEGVLIVGSGMSYHNMRGFGRVSSGQVSATFDQWLQSTAELDAELRQTSLQNWAKAPHAREAHPREEHLIPLLVAAGAAGTDAGKQVFQDQVMGVTVSALQFTSAA